MFEDHYYTVQFEEFLRNAPSDYRADWVERLIQEPSQENLLIVLQLALCFAQKYYVQHQSDIDFPSEKLQRLNSFEPNDMVIHAEKTKIVFGKAQLAAFLSENQIFVPLIDDSEYLGQLLFLPTELRTPDQPFWQLIDMRCFNNEVLTHEIMHLLRLVTYVDVTDHAMQSNLSKLADFYYFIYHQFDRKSSPFEDVAITIARTLATPFAPVIIFLYNLQHDELQTELLANAFLGVPDSEKYTEKYLYKISRKLPIIQRAIRKIFTA